MMRKMSASVLCLIILGLVPQICRATYPPWDIDRDGLVGFGDIVVMLEYFGEDEASFGDLDIDPDVNGDGAINILDLVLVARHYGDSYGDVYLMETDRNLRAVHMGGNWGTNQWAISNPPTEYFEFLRNLNVNWVGISVALHLDGSMDSTVERRYSGEGILTFTDQDLVSVIRAFHDHGFGVYLTLAFENLSGKQVHPVQRWQLGDPKILYGIRA